MPPVDASSKHYGKWEGDFQVGWEAHATQADFATLVPANLKIMPVTAEPKVTIDPNFVDSGETGRGRAERSQDEFFLGTIAAGASFETRLDQVKAYMFFASLLQNMVAGVETPPASGIFLHEWNPYTGQPALNYGLSIQKGLKTGQANSARQCLGNIVKQVKLSSDTNGAVKAAVETMAVTGAKANSTATTNVWQGSFQHRHTDAKVTLTDTGGGGAVNGDPGTLELTASNDLAAWYGTSQVPSALVLEQLTFQGSLVVSAKAVGFAQYDKFLAKTNAVVTVGFGTPGAVGYVELLFDATYSAYEDADKDKVQAATLNFTGGRASTSPTTTRIRVYAAANLAA